MDSLIFSSDPVWSQTTKSGFRQQVLLLLNSRELLPDQNMWSLLHFMICQISFCGELRGVHCRCLWCTMQPERLSMLLVCSITASRSLNPRAFYLVTASMSRGTSSRLRSMERLVLPCTHRSFFGIGRCVLNCWSILARLLGWPRWPTLWELHGRYSSFLNKILRSHCTYVYCVWLYEIKWCSHFSLNIARHGCLPQGGWEVERRRHVSSRQPRC